MAVFLSDLRFGARLLLKSPITSIAAILSLALGIGGTTTMFSAVDAILLRPLPFADPERLVMVGATSTMIQSGASTRRGGDLSPADYLDYRSSASFEGLAAVSVNPVRLTGDGTPEQALAAQVIGQRLEQRPSPLLAHTEGDGDGRRYQRRIGQGGERHEPSPVREVVERLGGHLQRQAGLARAARPRQRQQPTVVAADEVDHLSHLALPPEERRRLQGQVVPLLVERPERREIRLQVGVAQLPDALRLEQVLEPVSAEVPGEAASWELAPG